MRSERGITIIETTVILSVLFILAGVMSPIVSESVMTARAVRAKNDASMIAMGLINLQKDLGGDALAYGGGTLAAAPVRLPDVLATAGQQPQTDDPEGTLDDGSSAPVINLFASPANRNGNGNGNGNGVGGSSKPAPARQRKWLEVAKDALDDHLMTNRKGYRYRRPGEYGGWNGPYLSAELKGDPWGNQYLVNSHWLDGGSTAADSQGRPRQAVFIVSAGGNSVIETPFDQPITDARAYGDDIVIRLQ